MHKLLRMQTEKCKEQRACVYKDALSPILDKAAAADIIVIGSPICFGYPTEEVRSFMERLMFPVMSYNLEIDAATGETELRNAGKINQAEIPICST